MLLTGVKDQLGSLSQQLGAKVTDVSRFGKCSNHKLMSDI